MRTSPSNGRIFLAPQQRVISPSTVSGSKCICEALARLGFSRDEPTRSANSAAALRSALLRNTVLFSPAIRAVVPALP